MADEKWYQKTLVQAAIVTGAFTLIVTVVGVVLKTPSFGDAAKVSTQSIIPAPLPAGNLPNFDRAFSSESAAARRALRGNLRNISAAESGLKVRQVPAATFGFSHPLLFRSGDFDVDRVPNGRLSFELHKIAAEEVYAVAFVNADTQRKLQLNSRLNEPATLYSDMWKDAPYAVRIIVSSCEGERRGRVVTLDDDSNVIAIDCAPTRRK